MDALFRVELMLSRSELSAEAHCLMQPVGKMNEAKLSLLGTKLGERFPVLASSDDSSAVYIMLGPSPQ